MKSLAALIALAGMATAAPAQQHTRNALVYAARAVGNTTWNYGSLTINNTTDTAPIAFEVAVFADWKTGVGFAAATYKSYIDCNNVVDSIAIIDDTTNGVTPNDGRQGHFSAYAATQKVMTTRNASIPGSGFRLTGSSDTAADASVGGALYFNQAPYSQPPGWVTDDHVLGYRFNVTLAYTGLATRNTHVWTPTNRVGGFSTYNSLAGGSTTDYKADLIIENLDLTANWIPTPASPILFGSGALVLGRRRR